MSNSLRDSLKKSIEFNRKFNQVHNKQSKDGHSKLYDSLKSKTECNADNAVTYSVRSGQRSYGD
jgi:hypothetical protein